MESCLKMFFFPIYGMNKEQLQGWSTVLSSNPTNSPSVLPWATNHLYTNHFTKDIICILRSGIRRSCTLMQLLESATLQIPDSDLLLSKNHLKQIKSENQVAQNGWGWNPHFRYVFFVGRFFPWILSWDSRPNDARWPGPHSPSRLDAIV